MRPQQTGIADGEQRVTRGRNVRGAEPGEGRLFHDDRKLHAPQLEVAGRRDQPSIGECGERCLNLGQKPHPLAVEARLLEISLAAMRQEALGRDPFGRREHGIEGVARVFGEARPAAELLHRQPLVEQELEIAA